MKGFEMVIDVNVNELTRLEGSFPAGERLYVLNLLRFRASAEYPAGVTPVGASGQEAYFKGYLPAFGRIAAAMGITGVKPVWVGAVRGVIAGAAGEEWHAIAIVEYPSVATFRRIAESAEYARTAEPMRRAALEDWRLIAHSKMEMPG
jgi:uncharacterized protein (DUF1330 family)